MTLILAIVLIFAALISLLSLRRKQERLQIFNKTMKQKNSFLSMIESRLREDKESVWESFNSSLINKIKTNYYLIINNSTDKMKLLGIITLGIAFGFIFNYLYLNLNSYTVLFSSFIITLIILVIVKKRRLKKHFYESFPEALNIIIGVVSSGASVSVGFNECATKMDGVVATTMKEVCSRLELSENPHNVLLNSYRHLPFPEYYFFILTIMVNLDGGGELKDVLSRLSKMLTNNRILAKTRDSKTSELRMTVMILAAIPLGFLLLLKFISPDNYEYLINTEGGHIILYYVAGSVTFGIFLIKKMINKII